MLLVMDGVDLSSHVQESKITRGTVYRNTRTRVTIEGKKYEGKVKKLALEIPFDSMSETDLKKVLEVVDQDYVSLQYNDAILGLVVKTFIPTIGDISLIMEDSNGVTYWSGLVVSLEEQ